MASKQHGHRAIAVGISGGIGLAVPLLAHVATQSSPEAQATVATLSIPFALGSFAGVGAYTLSSSLFDKLDRREAERAGVSAAAAQGADAPAESPSASGDFSSAAVTTSFEADVERFFGRHGKPDDVPVIARAADAMSEAQAWEEIDSMLTDSSPISCDPSQSKDIYQIALEELARSGATGVVGKAAVSPQASAPAADAPAADATSVFMAIAASREPATSSLSKDRLDEMASREAAMDSLNFMVAEQDMPAVAPVAQPAAPVVVVPQAAVAPQRTSLIDLDLDEPSGFVFQSDPAPAQDDKLVESQTIETSSCAVDPFSSAGPSVSADFVERPVEVPVVDYSGHEEMWAAALEILAEPVEPVAPSGAHFAVRVAAVNEGRRANAMHAHVNQILDQELDHVDSQSMRHTSREFLRVIQGGTAAMPRLQAEEA